MPRGLLELTWIIDGEQVPYNGTKWKIEFGSNAKLKKTMKYTNTESGYAMDFEEG